MGITAAGGTPREKLWADHRATRDTELRKIFPAHVAEYWIGHEVRVAKRDYTQIMNDHFRAACGIEAKVARKAAQQPHAPCTQGSAYHLQIFQKPRTLQYQAISREVLF